MSLPALRRALLDLADAAEVGIDLLGRLLADVAGVEEDDVGVLDRRRLGEAVRRQQLRHALGVVDVHLAAERLDEDFFGAVMRVLARLSRLQRFSSGRGLAGPVQRRKASLRTGTSHLRARFIGTP